MRRKKARPQTLEPGPLELGTNVLVYARSSTDEQSDSCAQQLGEIRKELRRMGVARHEDVGRSQHHPHAGVYLDEGWSGWEYAPDMRPGCAALIQYCESNPRPDGEPGVILIWALSRLGRFKGGAEEAIFWLFRLRRIGWRVRSITQPGLDGAEGQDRLLRVIRAALESEKDTASSEDKSRDVGRGKNRLAEKGVWMGSMAPFGYERWAADVRYAGDHWEVASWVESLPGSKRNGNPDTHTVLRPSERASWVRQVFTWYTEGEDGRILSLTQIAQRLLDARVRPHRAGRWWHPETVAKILRNPAYRALQYDSEGTAHRALWEPLVSQEAWDCAQRRLKENARRGRGVNTAFVLSGLVTCLRCGSPLWGERARSGTGYRTYYRAKKAPGRPACETCRRRIRAEQLEQPVIESIARLADHPVVHAAVEEEERAHTAGASARWGRVQQIELEIEEATQQAERLVRAFALGGVVGAQAESQAATLNRQIERLMAERAGLLRRSDAHHPAREHADHTRRFRSLYENAAPAERKTLVQIFVVRVEVDPAERKLRVLYRRPDALL